MGRVKRGCCYTGPVRAVVLDWAGTAVDHGCLGPLAVFRRVFVDQGVSLDKEEIRPYMGLKKIDHIRALCRTPSVAAKWLEVHGRNPDENDVGRMFESLETAMVGSAIQSSDLIPGLLDSVAIWREAGIKIGSTTGYTGPIMAEVSRRAAEQGYEPDCIVTSSDVPGGRPHPWMCHLNAIRMEVYPLGAMVKIGDTISDIEEGLNAGMWTVGLTTSGNELGLSLEELKAMDGSELERQRRRVERRFEEAGAHFTAPSIAECPAIVDRIGELLTAGERP